MVQYPILCALSIEPARRKGALYTLGGRVKDELRLVLLDGGKVILKDVGILVVWVLEVSAIGAGIGGTEVAGGVIGGALCQVVLLLLALPGSLCPVWRAEDP